MTFEIAPTLTDVNEQRTHDAAIRTYGPGAAEFFATFTYRDLDTGNLRARTDDGGVSLITPEVAVEYLGRFEGAQDLALTADVLGVNRDELTTWTGHLIDVAGLSPIET